MARILSAVVMFALVAVSMLTPWSRVAFVLLTGIVSAYEIHKVLKSTGRDYPSFVSYLYLVLSSALCIFIPDAGEYDTALFFFCIILVISVCIIKKEYAVNGAIAGVFSLTYPAFLFCLIMRIMSTEKFGIYCAMGAFTTWICDTSALVGGKMFGKHKLCPSVSPHKTWEGSVCGSAMSVFAGVIVKAVWKENAPEMWLCIVIALLVSVANQFGDLAASLIKRMAGVKDYSNLIPGHGGAMDRADSLLFSIPAAYFLLKTASDIGIW